MTRAGKAAAVNLEVTYRKITYVLSPLSEEDWSELEYWMQERALDRELELIKKLPDEELRKTKQSEAYDRSRQIVIGSLEAGKIMLSVVGSIRVAWMALREHNDMSLDDVAKLCNDKKFQQLLQTKINRMNSADAEDVQKAKKKVSRKRARAKSHSKRKKKSR